MIFIKEFPVVSAALLSFLLILLISIFFHFTFCADDYSYLARVYSPEGLSISSFGPYIYRVPLWCFFAWVLFHLARFVPIHAFIYITISIFSIAFALLTFYVFENLNRRTPSPKKGLLIITTIVFALFPNHYEIFYWPTCMNYVPGLIFLALAFRCHRTHWKILFLTASFLTSEMYILPALAYAQLPALGENHFSFKAILGRSRWWTAAMVLTFGIKGLIYMVIRFHYRYDLIFTPAYLINQLKTAILKTWTIQFYKTNNLLSFIYLAALILAFVALRRNKILSPRFFGLFLATAVFVTAIYWSFGHQASRALFGAQVYILTILVFMLVKLDAKAKYFLPVLFIIFLIQNLYIFSIKDKNYHVLEKHAAELVSRIKLCPEPCILEVEKLNAGLRRDWVLDPDYWEFYLQWLHWRYFPNKHIIFNIRK